jgi:hypothetical protein
MIWIEALKTGVAPGTQGWDLPIMSAYASDIHPVFRILRGDDTASVVPHIVLHFGPSCDRALAYQVLARDFAHFKKPVQEDAMDAQKKAELREELMAHMSTWDDFINGKPEFREKKKKKTFLGIPSLLCG